MGAYYNEIDPYCAQWLRNLIDAGLIAPGEVDERDIREVTPGDLRGFTQCHFFAGIGGWSLALRLAGWDDSRPVWTGSCPCQPFSNAGKRQGANDERDLWPVFNRLIQECRPHQVFGEQVASAVGDGWLDRICADMEAEDYAVGAAVLGAHSVGAPHIRQRLWWVADASSVGGQQQHGIAEKRGWAKNAEQTRVGGGAVRVADAKRRATERQGHEMGSASSSMQGEARKQRIRADAWNGGAGGVGLEHADSGGRFKVGCIKPDRHCKALRGQTANRVSSAGAWSEYKCIPCADGKVRRIKPGIAPLAHGVSARVGKLRAYGNAIVPQIAAEFIAAYMEAA